MELPEHISKLFVPVDVHLMDGEDFVTNENIESTSPVVRPTARRLCSSKKAKAHDGECGSSSLFFVLKSTTAGLRVVVALPG